MRTKVVVAAVNALGSKLDRTDDEITVIEVRRPEPPMIVSQDLYFCLFLNTSFYTRRIGSKYMQIIIELHHYNDKISVFLGGRCAAGIFYHM